MHRPHRRPPLTWSDVTPKALWLTRREWIAGAAALTATPALSQIQAAPSRFSTDVEPTSFEDITGYNNFYEFGLDKTDPATYAGALTTDPWSVVIDGLVDKPGTYDLADVMKDQPLEERIYRLRCVEAWSMVIPWIGFELAGLLNRVGVQSGAKYVAFETLVRPEEMPGQSSPFIEWPYREGLRLDEAMHPLTILATKPERRADPAGRAMEIRLQKHQEHCAHQSGGRNAAHDLEHAATGRVWLLCQCEPDRGSPALEPGFGTRGRLWPLRRQAGYLDVQRL
jgi:methionine sulfoxide reductase catalytic subunit